MSDIAPAMNKNIQLQGQTLELVADHGKPGTASHVLVFESKGTDQRHLSIVMQAIQLEAAQPDYPHESSTSFSA